MKALDIISKVCHIAACVAVIIFCSVGIVHMEYAADVADWWMEQRIQKLENDAIKAEWKLKDGKY